MTAPAAALLRYLGVYLKKNPAAELELRKFYLKDTGSEISRGLLWRHYAGRGQPNLSTAIVYLRFLHLKGELIPSDTPGNLFNFKHPSWLKQK